MFQSVPYYSDILEKNIAKQNEILLSHCFLFDPKLTNILFSLFCQKKCAIWEKGKTNESINLRWISRLILFSLFYICDIFIKLNSPFQILTLFGWKVLIQYFERRLDLNEHITQMCILLRVLQFGRDEFFRVFKFTKLFLNDK
jgi:hypothetical protein